MIEAIAAVQASSGLVLGNLTLAANPLQTNQASFSQILRAGIETTNTKIAEADNLVTAFTLDNDIPAHKVTFALEEARLSLELMVQVRNRLVEGYQQIMNMQV